MAAPSWQRSERRPFITENQFLGTRLPRNQYGQSVKEQRWPWLLAAGLMMTSAAAAAWSTYLYWLPCRGSMLEGTLIHPSSGDGRTYEESTKLDPAIKAAMRACEARMDGDISGQAPSTYGCTC